MGRVTKTAGKKAPKKATQAKQTVKKKSLPKYMQSKNHKKCGHCSFFIHKRAMKYHYRRKHRDQKEYYEKMWKEKMPDLEGCEEEGCEYKLGDRGATLESHVFDCHVSERDHRHALNAKTLNRKNSDVLKAEYMRDAKYYNGIMTRINDTVRLLIDRGIDVDGGHNVRLPSGADDKYAETKEEVDTLYSHKDSKLEFAQALVNMRERASATGGGMDQNGNPASWENIADELELMLDGLDNAAPVADNDGFVMNSY